SRRGRRGRARAARAQDARGRSRTGPARPRQALRRLRPWLQYAGPVSKDENEKKRAEEKFVEDLLARGEAAWPDEDGNLPPSATHEIVEQREGERPKVRRRRVSAFWAGAFSVNAPSAIARSSAAAGSRTTGPCPTTRIAGSSVRSVRAASRSFALSQVAMAANGKRQ